MGKRALVPLKDRKWDLFFMAVFFIFGLISIFVDIINALGIFSLSQKFFHNLTHSSGPSEADGGITPLYTKDAAWPPQVIL